MFLVLISINHVLTARFAKNKYVNCPSDAKTKENETPIIPYIGPKIIIPSAVTTTVIMVAINGFLLFSAPKNFDV